MSDFVQPHRWQPTRLPCPWDSPGNNTGVGCHFLLQCMKVKSESEVSQSCPILSDPMDCSLPGSSLHGIFQARVLEWGAITFSEERDERRLLKKLVVEDDGRLIIIANNSGGFRGGSDSKVSVCNAGDLGSIPGLGRSPGEENDNPLQYSCLENSMGRGTL